MVDRYRTIATSLALIVLLQGAQAPLICASSMGLVAEL
jgi:hypothetical protein